MIPGRCRTAEDFMARKRIGQLSWVDGAVGWAQKRRRDRLTEIAALLDWRQFEALLSEIHSSRRGEPSYPPLAMFKEIGRTSGRARGCQYVSVEVVAVVLNKKKK